MDSYNEMFSYDDMITGSNLIIMVGVPGCGKSSKSEQIKNEQKYGSPYTIISTDSIREEITGTRRDQSKNKEVFEIVYQRLKEELENGHNVIYDATNCNVVHRARIIKFVKPYVNKIACAQMSTSLAQCFRNNYGRPHFVREEVIEQMYIKLKRNPPTINEGFDLIVSM